ncbi:MAG: hypothetical protein ACFCVC_13930 [Acidimicrobiia bacterium]
MADHPPQSAGDHGQYRRCAGVVEVLHRRPGQQADRRPRAGQQHGQPPAAVREDLGDLDQCQHGDAPPAQRQECQHRPRHRVGGEADVGEVGEQSGVIRGVGHGLHVEGPSSPVLVEAEGEGHRHHPRHRAGDDVHQQVQRRHGGERDLEHDVEAVDHDEQPQDER